MLISLYLVVPQVPYPSKPLPLGQVCVVWAAQLCGSW
jgi:hypothetical protein